ncbi:hydroxyisourate hydrolase [Cryobacterium sp. CG_9.6]|uniref:hydroxyisourate hydrolase n=1 Tax=Cryobacterium sp. CG_9.6 TaxID=2760710 RepID=UPI002473F2B0|nr:hydroxyisourate hydrolase [Cryobacterium sp. CG_9.6]MDH6236856.1 5-hydroxyisourate hydrolase [Cryobacterium sp. CG_9.6]
MTPSAHTSPSRVTTHVLDTVRGAAAAGLAVTLEQHTMEGWLLLATGRTDADGRVTDLGPADLAPGRFRLSFDTGAWFAAAGESTFYPQVQITFEIRDAEAHYHVPLLLSPFAYSTYRGS